MGFRGSSRYLISDLQRDVGSVLQTQAFNMKTVNFLSSLFSLQRICRKCYRGNLASIHSFNVNTLIYHLAVRTNQAQVWIGGFIRGRVSEGPMSRGRKLFLSFIKKVDLILGSLSSIFYSLFPLFIFGCTQAFSRCGLYSLAWGYRFLLEVALLVGAHRIESPGSAVGAQVGALRHMVSSMTGDRTHGPCMGRQLLHHWTTREGPGRGVSDSLKAHLLPSSLILAPEAGLY